MLLEIPVFTQEAAWSCLPACIRMCLAHLGFEATEDEVASRCGTSARGTSLVQAFAGIEAMGFTVDSHHRGEWTWVLDHLAAGEPVIADQFRGFTSRGRVLHAVVVCGATEDLAWFADPAAGRVEQLFAEVFEDRWNQAGGNAFVIERP